MPWECIGALSGEISQILITDNKKQIDRHNQHDIGPKHKLHHFLCDEFQMFWLIWHVDGQTSKT